MDFEIAKVLLKLRFVRDFFKKCCALTIDGYKRLKAKIANAWHTYDEEYKERHGELKAYCTGMQKPIPLDEVYVAVHFQHPASRYRSPEDVEQAFRERVWRHSSSSSDERQDGIQVANAEQYLMLLGPPGVGKSTFLRKVGLEALNGKKGNFEHKCIPVFLELKSFREDQIDIEALITQEFKICGVPYPEEKTTTALISGELLILFDGLDEVPASNVDNVIDKIGDFVDKYRQNRFIASCRIAAYTGGFRRFTEVEMAAFDDTQIEAYIEKWFDSTPDQYRHQLDEEMKTAEQCWKTLDASEHSATKELARNPLLLAMLCIVYDETQGFPRNRADLYKKALTIFLERWAAEKRVNRGASITEYLDIADETRMLSEIAAKNFDENRFFFSEDELIAQIQDFGEGNANTLETFNAPKVMEAILIDQGLFVEQVSGSYSFSHLTFQEYLTANYIVRDTRSIRELAKNHLRNNQWREVFLLTSGLMYSADDLLAAMQGEATKITDTPGLKTLFEWAEGMIDTTDERGTIIVKRSLFLHLFFALWQLNKMYEVFEYVVNQDRNRKHIVDIDSDLASRLASVLNSDSKHSLDIGNYLYFNRIRALNRALNRDSPLSRTLNLDLNLDIDRYLTLNRVSSLFLHRYLNSDSDSAFVPKLVTSPLLPPDFNRALNLAFDRYLNRFQDFFKYMDPDFLMSVSSLSLDVFDKQLQEQITFVNDMENVKFFKDVDLQRMVQRFDEQREFIKAAAEGKSVEPPAESIHNTWLSVLGITDEMLAIPRETVKSYVMYLEAVELIVACKEAAGRVSPEVWQQIEDRFFTVDAADIEN